MKQKKVQKVRDYRKKRDYYQVTVGARFIRFDIKYMQFILGLVVFGLTLLSCFFIGYYRIYRNVRFWTGLGIILLLMLSGSVLFTHWLFTTVVIVSKKSLRRNLNAKEGDIVDE
jgi:hypothetical protein